MDKLQCDLIALAACSGAGIERKGQQTEKQCAQIAAALNPAQCVAYLLTQPFPDNESVELAQGLGRIGAIQGRILAEVGLGALHGQACQVNDDVERNFVKTVRKGGA